MFLGQNQGEGQQDRYHGANLLWTPNQDKETKKIFCKHSHIYFPLLPWGTSTYQMPAGSTTQQRGYKLEGKGFGAQVL